MDNPIFVTRPALPDIDEFLPYIKNIWESGILTNNGPYHIELEESLCKYLNVPYISLFSNGTLALVTALQTLRISGEVITTPFSFAATTHALWWNNIQPVFVDIEADTYTLDVNKIEAAITPNTSAILPVHVYGYPCHVQEIEKIANRYGLKVIYDAAHTFAAKYKNMSMASFGDLSVLSFHATKVFNTIEGGAIICHDKATKQRIDYLKNFGIADEVTVIAPGINAKMNEFQAALGILQLKKIDDYVLKRKQIFESYQNALKDIEGITIPQILNDFESNYAYFPILFDEKVFGKSRDTIYENMKTKNIFSRRYFYPLISEFPTYRGLKSASPNNLPIALRVAENVLCLPIYPGLDIADIERILSFLKN